MQSLPIRNPKMPKLLLTKLARNPRNGEAAAALALALQRFWLGVVALSQAMALASPSNALHLHLDRLLHQIRLRLLLRSEPPLCTGEAG